LRTHLNVHYRDKADVEKIFLVKGSIKSVEVKLFEGYWKLRVLRLENSKIQKFMCDGVKLPNLVELRLKSNDIKNIDENTFRGMKNIEIIDFSHNEVNELSPNLFKVTKKKASHFSNKIFYLKFYILIK
jgi:Leucine-rich repeat (LRR) protein